MERFHHILFPVDFSERSERAAPAVASFAKRFGSKVTLLHALNMPPGAYANWYAFAALVDVAALREEAHRRLMAFVPDAFDGLDVHRVLVGGEPVAAIVKYAEDFGADLIVMPTHGHTKFRSLLLGSVTAGVLHDAKCPVWTEAHEESNSVHADVSPVVCAVDLSPKSAGLIEFARQLADASGAGLHVVHAGPSQAHGFDAAIEFADGQAAHAIREAALRHHAAILVIGRGAIQGPLGRLRTTAHEIIRQSPCPVLSV